MRIGAKLYKINKKALGAALLTAMALLSPAFALDFGGSLDDSTKVSTGDFSTFALDQKNNLSAWLKVPFNNSGTTYFAAEGKATFDYSAGDFAALGSGTPLFTLDLSLFKFATSLPLGNVSLNLSAGRFSVAETSGVVFSQVSDGLYLSYAAQRFNVSAYGGYTGLLNSQYVTMLDADSSTFSSDGTAVYACASPYVVVLGGVSFPYLFKNQTLGLEAVLAFGTKGVGGSNSGDSRLYFTAALNGPMAGSLFYTASTTLELEKFSALANLTKFSMTYFFDVKAASLGFAAVYASGSNGFLKPFMALTSNSALYDAAGTEYTGIVKAGVNGSVKPLEQLYVGGGADLAFDCSDGFGFKGFQWNASVKYQPFSDLQVSLSLDQFVGKDSSSNNAELTLGAVISF